MTSKQEFKAVDGIKGAKQCPDYPIKGSLYVEEGVKIVSVSVSNVSKTPLLSLKIKEGLEFSNMGSF